jgi:hypothetical protein
LQLEAGEHPFEGLGRAITLGDEVLGALTQMRDGGVAGVAQHTARVDGKQQLDLIEPSWRAGA